MKKSRVGIARCLIPISLGMKKMKTSISKNKVQNGIYRKIFIGVAVQLLLLMPLTAEAASVTTEWLTHTVTINQQIIDNSYAQYPLLVYKNITYLPLTDAIKKHVGLEQTFYEQAYIGGGEPVWFVGLADRSEEAWTVDAHQEVNQPKHNAQIVEGLVALNTIFSQDLYDNQWATYPLLQYRDVVYLPLTYDIVTDGLGWEYAYDEQNGLVIDTTDPIRPQFQSDSMASRPWNTYQQYAYYPDGYLSYPNRTLGSSRSWYLEYKQKGQPVQVVDISASLAAATKHDVKFKALYDDNLQQVLPHVADGQAQLFCVDLHNDENLLLTVDMQTAEVVLTPYTIPDNYGF